LLAILFKTWLFLAEGPKLCSIIHVFSLFSFVENRKMDLPVFIMLNAERNNSKNVLNTGGIEG